MKQCPNCHEYLGDSVQKCFNCQYDFSLKRIRTQAELQENRRQIEAEREIRNQQMEQERKRQEEFIQKARSSAHGIQSKSFITTGYTLPGVDIQAVFGMVSASHVIGTGFLADTKAMLSDAFGISSEALSEKIDTAREMAFNKLVEACMAKGGNAIIGLKVNYFVLAGNMLGVALDGTAVFVE